MIRFNCTVKDLFRRRNMIDKAVRSLADNGYTDYASAYAMVRSHIYNAIAYASFNMKDYEYKVALSYLESRDSERMISEKMFYTQRTIRRYIRKACEYIEEYYANELGIRLLPFDTKTVGCRVSGVSFWDKANSLMSFSIENTCIVIAYYVEQMSINAICSNFGMGNDKVKKIVSDFGAVVTLYNIPSEKRSAV